MANKCEARKIRMNMNDEVLKSWCEAYGSVLVKMNQEVSVISDQRTEYLEAKEVYCRVNGYYLWNMRVQFIKQGQHQNCWYKKTVSKSMRFYQVTCKRLYVVKYIKRCSTSVASECCKD